MKNELSSEDIKKCQSVLFFAFLMLLYIAKIYCIYAW